MTKATSVRRRIIKFSFHLMYKDPDPNANLSPEYLSYLFPAYSKQCINGPHEATAIACFLERRMFGWMQISFSARIPIVTTVFFSSRNFL